MEKTVFTLAVNEADGTKGEIVLTPQQADALISIGMRMPPVPVNTQDPILGEITLSNEELPYNTGSEVMTPQEAAQFLSVGIIAALTESLASFETADN
jgi:hypothetical protein